MSDGHRCPAPGCTRQVPSDKYACMPHYLSLPEALKRELWRSFRAEPLGDRHVKAMAACDEFLRKAAS